MQTPEPSDHGTGLRPAALPPAAPPDGRRSFRSPLRTGFDVRASPVLPFLAGLIVSATACAVVYLGFVQTAGGQRLENLALAGAAFRDAGEIEGSLTSLSRISVLSFAAAIILVALIAIARRRWRLAVVTAVLMAGSVIGAEILKDVLPRPILVEAPSWLLPNTFPSGHATIAVASGLGLLVVAPERLRWLVLPIAAVYAAVIAQAIQVAGWHRLSGTLGAAFLVTSVACAVLVVLAGRGHVRRSPGGGVHPRIRAALLVAAGLAVAASALIALLPVAFPLLIRPSGADSAFAHTALDLLGMGLTILTVVLFGALIEPFSLDPVEPAPAS
jgi:membrane-associated phospholipid phosphatase